MECLEGGHQGISQGEKIGAIYLVEIVDDLAEDILIKDGTPRTIMKEMRTFVRKVCAANIFAAGEVSGDNNRTLQVAQASGWKNAMVVC